MFQLNEPIHFRGGGGPEGVGGEAEGGGHVGRRLHQHLPAADISCQAKHYPSPRYRLFMFHINI